MDPYLESLLRARVLSGSVLFLVAACGESRRWDGGAAPLIAGDYVFSVPAFTIVSTDGSRFAVDGASEVIRVTQSANAIAIRSITFPAEALTESLGVDALDTHQSGRVRSDSTFTIEKRATLRGRVDGEIYDVVVNIDGRFTDDGWSGQGGYSLGSRKLKVTCNGQAPFFGAKIAAGAELRSETALTGAVPSKVYRSPKFVFRTIGMRRPAPNIDETLSPAD